MSIALMGDHRARRALGLFPSGLRAHRPCAGWRLDLAAAAPDRTCARQGAFAARRETARRNRRSNGASSIASTTTRALMDEALKLARRLAAGPDASAYAAMRRQFWESPHNSYEAAARSGTPAAAGHAGAHSRFHGRRRGLPPEAPCQIQGQVTNIAGRSRANISNCSCMRGAHGRIHPRGRDLRKPASCGPIAANIEGWPRARGTLASPEINTESFHETQSFRACDIAVRRVHVAAAASPASAACARGGQSARDRQMGRRSHRHG